MRCPKCDFTTFDDTVECKKCGHSFIGGKNGIKRAEREDGAAQEKKGNWLDGQKGMTKSQKAVLVLFAVVSISMVLYPPWKQISRTTLILSTWDSEELPESICTEYCWLWSGPVDGITVNLEDGKGHTLQMTLINGGIDYARLSIQFVPTLIFAAGIFFFLGFISRRKRRTEGRTAEQGA